MTINKNWRNGGKHPKKDDSVGRRHSVKNLIKRINSMAESTFWISIRAQQRSWLRISFQLAMMNFWTQVCSVDSILLTTLLTVSLLLQEQVSLTGGNKLINGMTIQFKLARTEQISSMQHLEIFSRQWQIFWLRTLPLNFHLSAKC